MTYVFAYDHPHEGSPQEIAAIVGGKAANISVMVDRRSDHVIARTLDDGAGFDTSKLSMPTGPKGGFGLFNIKERLEYMGGQLDITSEPGKGTRVVMKVPLSHKKES